jgi:multiple antibiotic resistance protein
VARRACLYAAGLMLFFLVFGNLVLRIFDVPLSMVRIVGGIVLMRVGFALFEPAEAGAPAGSKPQGVDVAFTPLAMPLMVGPGALATIIGMSATVKESHNVAAFAALAVAILLTAFATFVILAFARVIAERLGPLAIDATSRIVGFFVASMGMGLVFHGLSAVLASYGVVAR